MFLTGLSPCKCGQKGTDLTEKAPRVLQFHRAILRYSSPGDAPRHIQTSKWENVSSPSSYLFIRIIHIKTAFIDIKYNLWIFLLNYSAKFSMRVRFVTHFFFFAVRYHARLLMYQYAKTYFNYLVTCNFITDIVCFILVKKFEVNCRQVQPVEFQISIIYQVFNHINISTT